MYEQSYQGWNQEPMKLVPWVETFVFCCACMHARASLYFAHLVYGMFWQLCDYVYVLTLMLVCPEHLSFVLRCVVLRCVFSLSQNWEIVDPLIC